MCQTSHYKSHSPHPWPIKDRASPRSRIPGLTFSHLAIFDSAASLNSHRNAGWDQPHCQWPSRPDETTTNCSKSHGPLPQPRSRHHTTDFSSLTTLTSRTRPRKIQLERISTLVRSRRHLLPSSPQNHERDMTPNSPLALIPPHLGADQLISSHLRISKILAKPGHTIVGAVDSIPSGRQIWKRTYI